MRLTINSKYFGTCDFFMRDGGGYVYIEGPEKFGPLGRQLCEGGSFLGSTIYATPETFVAVVRKWHAQRVRRQLYNFDYGLGA